MNEAGGRFTWLLVLWELKGSDLPPIKHPPHMHHPTMYTKTRSILRRLDELESCLSSRVARHRRRATNLLDVTPSTRRTHVRYVYEI